nr:glycosyl hydrolase family 18 protein [Actinorugispora endophytica]
MALTTAPALADTGATVVYSEGAKWETGYSAQFTINNPGPAALDDWTVRFTLPSGASVGSLWNATLAESGGVYTLTPPSWGASVPAGGSYSIGFNGVGGSGGTTPETCTINDAPCDGSPGEPDTEAPTAPGGPESTAQTSGSVTLAWTASTDDTGVAGYEVLDADDQVVRNVVGTATTATVGGLTADTEYTFRVRAYDAAGNKSAPSAPVTVRTAEDDGENPDPVGDERRVGYFTQWGIYDRGFLVDNLDDNGTASKLTHINYAFANINTNGECFLVNQAGQGDAWADYGRSFTADQSVDGVGDAWDQDLRGNFNQLRELKEKYPDLRVNISIGGWTWSENFSDAVLTAESRERLVDSCVDMYLRGNLPVFDGAGGPGSAYGVFDGIDLDWEWPASEGYEENTVRPEDRENFTAVVDLFREKLDALGAETGRDYTLSSFMPADPEKVDLGYEVPQLMEDFDFITVQGYDYHGGWEGNTNHQSNITQVPGDPGPRTFSSEIALEAWVSRGADPADIVFGVPYYGRGWTGVAPGPNGDGLFQAATGPAPGPYEAGIDDFKNLKNLSGYTLHRDAGTAWLYNGSTFWQFDDAVSMTEKVDWAQSQGLGGIMIWSLDGDDSSGTLINAIDSALAD